MKKKFNAIDFIISISFALFLSLYFIPQGIGFLMHKQHKLPQDTKERMLLAGKSFLEKNKSSNTVTLLELFNSGYLIKDEVIPNKDCFPSISIISKRNGSYYLDLKCVEDDSKLTLLE